MITHFGFFGFSPKSEILVVVTHVGRNFMNCSWSKPLLGETKSVITRTGAQALLSQALDGGQVNESVTCCNPGPYWTTSGVWLKIYLVTCILSNSSVQWIYHEQLSPISQGSCFVLPLVASHGCYQRRYPIMVPSATRLSGVVCHRGESCGRTAKQMLLITSFAVFALFVSKTKEENFNKLHNAPGNHIPFKTAKQFFLPTFCATLSSETCWCKAKGVFAGAKSTLITEGVGERKSEFLSFLTLYSKSINTHGFSMIGPAGS